MIPLVGLVCIGVQAQTDATAILSIQNLLESGNLDDASRLLAQSIARYPNDGGLVNLRGILHARRDQLLEARSDFERAVRLNPSLTPAWKNLGRACKQTDDVPCAIQAWQHVSKAKPDDPEAHESLALLYEQQGQFAESLRELDREKQDNLLLRAVDLCSLGRLPEAKTAAARLAKQSSFTEDDLSGIHGALDSPKSAGVVAALVEGLDARGQASTASLRRLVVAYEQLQRPADASRILERIASVEPGNTRDLLELARLAEGSKNYEGALGYLAHARDLEPGNGRIHFLFGLVAGELNLPIEAKHSFEKALAIEPGNPNYNYAMGTAILATRNAADAAVHFKVFVEARPADPRGHYALGLAHFASGDYGSAREQLKITETDPGLAGASEYFLGRIARLEGELEEATRRLHKAVELLPGFSEAHTELARLALEKKDIEGARVELDRALRLFPESFQANQQLLVLYRRTHDPRVEQQSELLKRLDEDRSRRAELMLRTIEVSP